MIKKLLLSIACIALTSGAYADVLTPEQALQRLQSSRGNFSAAKDVTPRKLVHTSFTESSVPALYVFDRGNASGFIVLSADDAAAPVLGYSDSGSFDAGNIPAQMKWWMEEYGRQMQFARENSLPAYTPSKVLDGYGAIEPLLSTKWNQDAPYNNDCPSKGSRRAPTGCVATSMAQVMNYFQYPDIGQGRKNYTCGAFGRLEMNFGVTPFDWDNMLDVYNKGEYNDTQAAAVAYLMKACGYSVEMGYTLESSGAISNEIPGALVKYFKYDEGARYLNRIFFSEEEWSEMIYDNLKNVGPVIYDGSSPQEGGHSFVCDGYDGNGYFHFNWGWGGAADGYFLLNALNPTTQGIGGSAGGFNFSQDVVLGIRKPTGEPVPAPDPVLSQYGGLIGSASGMQLSFTLEGWNPRGWANYTGDRMRVVMGVIIESDALAQPLYVESNLGMISFTANSFISAASNTPAVEIPASLADGRYKVTLATRASDGDTWYPVRPVYGLPNLVYIVKSGNSIEVENLSSEGLVVESAEFTSDCYYDYPVKVSITIHNPSEYTMTRGFSPVLVADGKRQFTGESVLCTLQPGETLTREWVASFTEAANASVPASGESKTYTLQILNPEIGLVYGTFGDIEMSRLKASFKVRSRGTEVVGASTVNYPEIGTMAVVDDAHDIEIKQNIELVSGYFAYPLVARVYLRNEDTGNLNLELEKSFEEIPFISTTGEVFGYTTTMDFFNGVADTPYTLITYYVRDNRLETLGQTRFIIAGDGVASVDDDRMMSVSVDRKAKTLKAYAPDGVAEVRVMTPDGRICDIAYSSAASECESVVSLDGVESGIAIVSVVDRSGNHRSFKIAL